MWSSRYDQQKWESILGQLRHTQGSPWVWPIFPLSTQILCTRDAWSSAWSSEIADVDLTRRTFAAVRGPPCAAWMPCMDEESYLRGRKLPIILNKLADILRNINSTNKKCALEDDLIWFPRRIAPRTRWFSAILGVQMFPYTIYHASWDLHSQPFRI